ncbi:hypothetical protein CR513_42406, partial [Mucuna pruriens]
MGSNGSKPSSSCSSSSSSSGSLRKGRSKGLRVFQSYCLGTTSGSHHSDNEDQGTRTTSLILLVQWSDQIVLNGKRLMSSYVVSSSSLSIHPSNQFSNPISLVNQFGSRLVHSTPMTLNTSMACITI